LIALLRFFASLFFFEFLFFCLLTAILPKFLLKT
jgi:hypothetical protein